MSIKLVSGAPLVNSMTPFEMRAEIERLQSALALQTEGATRVCEENERLRAENTNLRASMDSIRSIVLAARDLEQKSNSEG